MLVDLGRNDLGRVCAPGSVEVTELMDIERYSHVMHLVSNVKGKLQPGMSAVDALRSTFPAGTVSGAPKIRAMQIIAELESEKRGAYAGAVGYVSYSGNMDMAITIRTILLQNRQVYVQAGAGIVYDSVPESEYNETLVKAEALFKAVRQAEEANGGSIVLRSPLRRLASVEGIRPSSARAVCEWRAKFDLANEERDRPRAGQPSSSARMRRIPGSCGKSTTLRWASTKKEAMH